MRIKTARKVSRVVRCIGGPWDAKYVRFPVQSIGCPLSLHIKVGDYHGQYNLNTGLWKNDGQS